MWGKSKARRALVVAAVPALSVLAGVGGVAAQPIFQPTFSDSQLCVTADMENALLQGAIQYTPPVAVSLPAGEIVIPEAISYDEYEYREFTPTQTSERWEIEFLNADGDVIATSDAVPDVADGVRRAEYIGALGSVTLTEPAVAVRAHHRTDLPPNDTPNSVHVSGVTLCWDEVLTPEICVDDDGQEVTPNDDGSCPGETVDVCLDDDGAPLTDDDGEQVVPDGDGNCPTPAEPQCTDADGAVVDANDDGTCPDSSTPQCLDEDGNSVTPNEDGSCSEPAAPQCTDADGTAIDANDDGTCPTPTTPQCVDEDGNAVAAEADGSCAPSGPALPSCTDADGETVAANDDGTCPDLDPAGPIVTPQQPSPAQPNGGQLPITGSESMILLLSGMWLLAAGTTATMFVRTR